MTNTLLKDSFRKFMGEEADRVLDVANETLYKMKVNAEKSSDFNEIKGIVENIEILEKKLHDFKGYIPDENWADYQVIDIINSFVKRGDNVLELCK